MDNETEAGWGGLVSLRHSRRRRQSEEKCQPTTHTHTSLQLYTARAPHTAHAHTTLDARSNRLSVSPYYHHRCSSGIVQPVCACASGAAAWQGPHTAKPHPSSSPSPAQHHHSSGWSTRHGSEWGAGLRQPERRTSQFQVLVLADCPQPPPSQPVEKQKSCQPLLFANWHDAHSAGLHA